MNLLLAASARLCLVFLSRNDLGDVAISHLASLTVSTYIHIKKQLGFAKNRLRVPSKRNTSPLYQV
jgi:hypothetical protein